MTSVLAQGSSDADAFIQEQALPAPPLVSRVPCGAQTYSKAPARFDGIERYADHADGPYVWDEDGNQFVDYVAGLGPVLLGHRHRSVERAVLDQLARGSCFSLPTRLEHELAELLAELVPCAEASRFAKNGADATAAAVRLARAVTDRDMILRCGYHGFHDWCVEDSRGVPRAVQALRRDFRFNDLAQLGEELAMNPVAAVILEAVPTRQIAWPDPHFLSGVRQLCNEFGALLIFDETVTGFRIHRGGAQQYFGVTPDLATFSKGMGNGFPIAAICGRAELLREFERGVFFSTTFGGDPIGLAAAIATLTHVRDYHVPERLGIHGQYLREVWRQVVGDLASLEGYDQRLVERWPADPVDEAAATRAGTFRRAVIANGVLAQGYYNVMLAHSAMTLDQTADAWAAGVRAVRAAGV